MRFFLRETMILWLSLAWAVHAEAQVWTTGTMRLPPAAAGESATNEEEPAGPDLSAATTGGEETKEPEADEEGGIADNSFLVEEAYNQEPGVVQHIFNWAWGWDEEQGDRTRTFDFLFTQEWPVFSQRHQFSYGIPLSRMTFDPEVGAVESASGLGDIQLNYRYQILLENDCQPAIAPRFTLIVPTGDEDEGLGSGELGYQFNLPISRTLKDWAFHFNAGATFIPGVDAGVDPLLDFEGRTLNGYNLGASVIWLARPDFNLLLESVALWDEELTADGSEDHIQEVIISPGFRWAPYTRGSTQLVLGAAVPIGLSDDATDISLFLYMSFEHPFNARGRQ
jgi:hypothetical protein